MTRSTLFVLAATLLFTVTGCESGRVVAEGEYRAPIVRNDSPRIRTFGLIDSYGYDSEFSAYGSMELNPYEDYGIFNIYWEVDSAYDYTVDIYVNDVPDLAGAFLIGTDYCGPHEPCDRYGQQICEYTPDYYMGCGLDLTDASYYAQSMDSLVYQHPETVYISVEVCPIYRGYCEAEFIPVDLY